MSDVNPLIIAALESARVALRKHQLYFIVKGVNCYVGNKGRRIDFMAENIAKCYQVRWLSNYRNPLKPEAVERFFNKWIEEGNLWQETKKPNCWTILTDRGRIFMTLIRNKQVNSELKKV
jgi:hypothetical protein